MTEDQETHLRWIKANFESRVDAKYRNGVVEHGGNLWENSLETLLDFAIDEAIDQVTYLLTLKDRLAYARNNLQAREEHS